MQHAIRFDREFKDRGCVIIKGEVGLCPQGFDYICRNMEFVTTDILGQHVYWRDIVFDVVSEKTYTVMGSTLRYGKTPTNISI